MTASTEAAVESTMLRLKFPRKMRNLVRGVHQLFPHMADQLVDEIVRHQKHREVNQDTLRLSARR